MSCIWKSLGIRVKASETFYTQLYSVQKKTPISVVVVRNEFFLPMRQDVNFVKIYILLYFCQEQVMIYELFIVCIILLYNVWFSNATSYVKIMV